MSAPAVEVASPYRPHAKQYEFHMSDARFRAIFAGRRGGKTTALSIETIMEGVKRAPLDQLVISDSYPKLRDVNIPSIRKWLKIYGIEHSYHQNFHEIRTDRFRIIFRSGDQEGIARGLGETIGGIALDEMREYPIDVWHAVYPLTYDHQARVWGGTTPPDEGNFWSHDVFWTPHIEGDKRFACWQFPSYENPHLDIADIAQAQKDLPPDVFKREILGEFVRGRGLVYSYFDRSEHVIRPHSFKGHWCVIEGIDIGARNPTCVSWIATDGERYEIIAEHYLAEARFEIHAIAIMEQRKRLPDGLVVVATFIDPSALQAMYELAKFGIFASPADNSLQAGISLVGGHLSHGRLKIWDTCVRHIESFERYSWPRPRLQDGTLRSDRPRGEYSHAPDAVRYALMGGSGVKPTRPVRPRFGETVGDFMARSQALTPGVPIDNLLQEGHPKYD